ncbi:MAG TPA: hypothetical protein VFK38_02355 [Candidatus Limnocylindrales bacterium]|nr:hypothetical protein [Candidatus Limnocylindrales bacterium]
MPTLADLLAQESPDPRAVEQAAADAFNTLKRTDMRSGVANMIRRLAQLAGEQPITQEGWQALRDAARLLDRPSLTPQDVRQLDQRLKALGLDVERRAQTQEGTAC